MYVVAIDLDIDRTDYKAFSVQDDAEQRYYRAWIHDSDEIPIKTDSGDVYVSAARLYVVDSNDARTAIELVKAEKGNCIKDTENPFPDLKIDLDSIQVKPRP